MATDRLAANLSNAMLNQTDPEIVRSGAPAYLLLLDSLIEEDPDDQSLLYAGARLYSAYAGGLVTDPNRQKNPDPEGSGIRRSRFVPDKTRHL